MANKIKYNDVDKQWELVDETGAVLDYAQGSASDNPWDLTWGTVVIKAGGSLSTNADSACILEGRTAVSKGKVITGTITEHDSTTVTPGSIDVMLGSGYYPSITVLGDDQLKSSNIKKDVEIFGVRGSLETTSTGIDVSSVTATPDDVLADAYFVDKGGAFHYGNIQTVTPSVSNNVFTVGKGYVEEDTTIEVPVSSNPTVNDNVVTVYKGYVPQNTDVTVPEMGAITNDGEKITVPVGYNKTVQEFEVGGTSELPTDINVTSADVKDGVFYIDSKGAKQEGTMPIYKSKTVTLSTSEQTLPAGYYEGVTVPGNVFANLTASQIELATSDASRVLESETFITGLGAVKQGTMPDNGILDVTLTDSAQEFAAGYYGGITVPAQPSGSEIGSSDVAYGYIDASGNFQPLDLSGDTPVASGTAESMTSLNMFKTGANEPSYSSGGGSSSGSGTAFYECASYTPAYTKRFFTLSGSTNDQANGTYVCTTLVEPPPEEETSTPTAVWVNENGCTLKEYYYTEFNYQIDDSTGSNIYNANGPYWSRVTDFNTIPWVDSVWSELDHTLTFSAWQTEEVPSLGWTGYKVTQNAETGLWSRTDEYKENMPAPFYTPQVGMIYSEDTSIACSGMFSNADNHLVALFHFDENANDTMGNVTTTLTEKSIEQNGKFDGCLLGDTYNANSADSSYYMEITGLPELDAFTVEWWQYDEDSFGDGGAFMWQPATDALSRSTFASVSITTDDSKYISGKWKHLAFVREAGQGIVTQYINGKNVGTVSFSDKIGGRTVNFVGLAPTTGQAKTVRIDELAFYGTAKYTADFTPRNIPIID